MELHGYRLEEVVGDGRSGRVYRAVRLIDGQVVAVRQVRPELVRERGVTEALLALPKAHAPLRSTVLVPVVDAFDEQGAVCIVEPWVEGEALQQAFTRGRTSADDVIAIALDVLDALQELHTKGIVHGDISPANLVLGPRGPRLTGLQVATKSGRRKLQGSALLRSAWDAPELGATSAPTPSSDLFAIGACLHIALTGEERWQDLPPAVDPLDIAVLRALSPEPGQRYPDAATFRSAILALRKRTAPEPVVAPAPERLKAPDRPLDVGGTNWKRAATWGGLAAAGLMVVAAVISLWPDVPDGMVEVPKGSVDVGMADGPPSERPGFSFRHPRFFLDQHEVTVGDYARCVKAGTCADPSSRSPDASTDPRMPQASVSWLEARAYCHFVDKRLPTENEWEAAARHFGGLYPFGDHQPTCADAWYGRRRAGLCPDEGVPGPQLVPESLPDGLPVDLAGNLWEFVDTDFSDVRASGTGDASQPGASTRRAVRGGAWSSDAAALRSSARLAVPSDHWAGDTGFRCALSDD